VNALGPTFQERQRRRRTAERVRIRRIVSLHVVVEDRADRESNVVCISDRDVRLSATLLLSDGDVITQFAVVADAVHGD
jgi:hypothetical protein